MNFDLKLTKKDVVTMVLLAIVFFGIATWNVGEVKAPVTNWQSTSQQLFYVDLGSAQQVQNVYFWVQSGNASVDVSSGAPGNWSYVRSQSLQSRATDYMVQVDTPLNVNTQYLEFNVYSPSLRFKTRFLLVCSKPLRQTAFSLRRDL